MSAYHTAANKLRTARILNVANESPTVKTFAFKDKQCARARPGQFLMLWIPGTDEIPLSIMSASEDGIVTAVVKKVGEATQAMHNMKTGETIGVRGPFGNNFTLRRRNVMIVGGGTGIAPLLFLTKKLVSSNSSLTFVIGAKSRSELLYIDELKKLCNDENVIATTEDGSYGLNCLATEPVEKLMIKKEFDMVYTCGPERMMRKVFDLAEMRGVAIEASLERLMRCAIGLCGSCVIGKYRVCRDGPVFEAERLRQVKAEFGFSRRDFDGRRIAVV